MAQGIKFLHFAALPLAAALTLAGSAGTSAGDKPAGAADPALESYLPLVAEFDLRRRVNVLFPNPQTLFDGLQVGFVNVASGNLTFVRRDLVTRANGPLVFGRVYDSRLGGDGSFGPGWRLSLAEELVVGEGSVAYVDRSGALRRFVVGIGGYVPARPTPRHAGTRIVVGESEATVFDGDGSKRTFKPFAGTGQPWRIASVETGPRRVDFRYRDGRLAAVVHGARTMFHIRRDAAGRILQVSDDHGRSVRYSYDWAGRLKDVYDVAGNLWWHEYDANGRLVAAIGANRQPYLEVRYDAKGRVQQSRTGREYAFDYQAGRTLVTEGTGQRHVFERNAGGATVGFHSSTGVRWRALLNANNRVKVLTLPDRTLGYDYDGAGRITMVEEITDSGSSRQDYVYDGQGRLAAVRSLDGEELLAASYGARSVGLSEHGIGFDYELTPAGRIAAVWNRNVRFDADYDSSGDLAALHHNGYSVRFERDALGRIVATTYPSGQRSRYFHDLVGNRQLAEFGGGSVAYRHDPAGNIVAAEIRERDGTVRRQTTTVGPMNRVERIAYEPGRSLGIEYDRMGRPVAFDDAVQRVAVEYGADGSVSRLSLAATGEALELDGRQPPGVRTLAERRLAVFSGDVLGAAHPVYGPVRFAETTFDALPLDAAETGVPRLAAARDLFAAALPLFAGSFDAIVRNFEKPSNPVFQPAEYRSTNCCVPYSGETCGPDGPGGPAGTAPSFTATVNSVDACMRRADARVRAITPHQIQYNLAGFKKPQWLDNEHARADIRRLRGKLRYYTALNISRIEAMAEEQGKSGRAAIREILAHEYGHHIRLTEDERIADFVGDMILNRTGSCA